MTVLRKETAQLCSVLDALPISERFVCTNIRESGFDPIPRTPLRERVLRLRYGICYSVGIGSPQWIS